MKPFARLFAVLLLALPLFAGAAETIDINTADKQQLMEIDGVGEARAQAIIEYREQNGPFASVEELTQVSGIGAATLENNRDRLTAGGE